MKTVIFLKKIWKEFITLYSRKKIISTDIIYIKNYYLNEFQFDLSDSKNIGHSFYDNFQKLLQLKQNTEEYNYILLHNLFGPIEYLEELKKLSKKKYRVWKNRLIKNIRNVAFYGDLFELYITWTFVQKKIKFTTSDKPDNIIIFENSEIFVECTSSQFNFDIKPSKENILSKLVETLHCKMKKKYSKPDCALFIDITNLCFHANSLNLPITEEELSDVLISASQKTIESENLTDFVSFGAILFMFFDIYKTSIGEINYSCNGFNIRENSNANVNLIKFLKSNNLGLHEKKEIKKPKFNHEI
jgi:hypothetical protein